MKVDRKQLERSVERFDMPEPALERLHVRRERRVRRQRIQAGVAALLIVVATATLVLRTSAPAPAPAAPPAPAWSTADIDGVIVTNPGGWHLAGIFTGRPREIWLANFAPDLSSTDPCRGMPNDGAILRIDPYARGAAGTWPVELTAAGETSRGCDGERVSARWTVGDRTFEAVASFGTAVSSETRTSLEQAFSALTFADPRRAISTSTSCFLQRDPVGPMLAEVLAAETESEFPWTMFALSTSGCVSGAGVIVVTSDEGLGFESSIPPTQPRPLGLRHHMRAARSLVAGVVGPEVARVRLQTDDGRTQDARLIPTDALFPGGYQVYLTPLTSIANGTVTSFDDSGTPLQQLRSAPGVDCIDAPTTCEPHIPAGGIVAESIGQPGSWLIRERDGGLDLYDHNGELIASTGPADGLTVTSAEIPGTANEVVFGLAPRGTAVVLPKITGYGWGLALTARLADGTTAYWVQDEAGGTAAIATFDAGCRLLDARGVDGSPEAVTEQECLHSGS